MTRCSGSITALRLYYGSIKALLRLYKCAEGGLLLATACDDKVFRLYYGFKALLRLY
jgi:hypothetical protein